MIRVVYVELSVSAPVTPAPGSVRTADVPQCTVHAYLVHFGNYFIEEGLSGFGFQFLHHYTSGQW